jgi:recombination protein RecT
LEPNTPLGHCYLIPRFNKKQNVYICSFEMGYQGMLELAYRSKMYRHISARVVYKGDDFLFKYGTGQNLNHVPRWLSEIPEYVYAIYELDNGGEEFAVWSWGAIMRHAEEFSESYDSNYSPWKSSQTSKEEMAKKTVLKTLLKYGPKSVELAGEIVQAMNSDGNTVIARKANEGGEMKFQFDVEGPAMIEAPDEEAKKFMGQVNGAAKNGASTAAKEAETAPVQTAGTKPKAQAESTLFQKEEDEVLAEQYERQQAGFEPPNFD